MTKRRGTPGWYVEGDVATSVRKARQSNVTKSKIIWGLSDVVFDDVPKARIKAIVESVPEDTVEGEDSSIPLSQPPSVQENPREQPTRIASAGDMQYLSPREAARMVGLALEQFDGTTIRPPVNESTECDVYWNRQHTTIGLRLVPAMPNTVSEQHVMPLIEGQTTVANVRDPSELAVVTNGRFTEKAKSVASSQDILYFDGGHLEAWLRRAKISREALGTVLEEGENHDGPLNELVELSGIPSSVDLDPLKIERAIEEGSIPDGTGTTRKRQKPEDGPAVPDDTSRPRDSGIRAGGTTKPSGETGTLYADPDEDGDYGAFDRFVDDIKKEGPATEPAGHDDATSSSDDNSPTDSGNDTEDVSRKELLFDLKDIETQAGEPITSRNIDTYGSYPVSQYKTEFGSITAALDAANIEYEGDSL